jgi:DNA-directed RNA polymerase subunit M/transcription elongation factor TFIIS
MARKSLCSNCGEVLEPTNKDHIVCGNCGEFQWIGPEEKAESQHSGNNKVMKSVLTKRKRNKRF